MRVSIEHADKTSGLVFKTHQIEVAVAVVFSEEEQAIIKGRKLKDTVVLKREPNSKEIEKRGAAWVRENHDLYHLYIRDLTAGKPERFLCDTPIDAKIYEQNLMEALKTLKGFISGNAETGTAKTFEL